MRTAAFVTFVACALAACGPESSDPETPGTTTVTDSAGVEIVMNGGDGSLGELELREDLRLGVLEGEGPEQFSEVYAVGVTADGSIAVGDNGSGTVRVFARDGTFLRALGGRGEGPGEVSTVNDVLVAGDTIAVIDWQRGGKMALHALDGTFAGSTALRRPDGTRFLPMHRSEAGWLVTRNSNPPRPAQPGDSAVSWNEYWFADPEDPQFEGPPVYRTRIYTLYATPGEGEFSVDWGMFRSAGVSGLDARGRMYLGHPWEYRIDVLSPEGMVRSVRRPWAPRSIGPDDIEALKAATVHAVDTVSRIPDASKAQQRTQILERLDRQAALPMPATMAPVVGILVSPDGSFWAQVADPGTLVEREVEGMFGMFGGAPPRPNRWDLFDPEGRLIGSVTLPARFRPEAVAGREVVGVWFDEFDVEYVVRYVAGSEG